MKTSTTRKSIQKKVVTEKEKPISISIKLNDSVQEIQTDNILQSLRELNIESMKVKTVSIFTITRENKTFHRILRIPLMRMLLANDVRRQIFAKTVNTALGISVTNYD